MPTRDLGLFITKFSTFSQYREFKIQNVSHNLLLSFHYQIFHGDNPYPIPLLTEPLIQATFTQQKIVKVALLYYKCQVVYIIYFFLGFFLAHFMSQPGFFSFQQNLWLTSTPRNNSDFFSFSKFTEIRIKKTLNRHSLYTYLFKIGIIYLFCRHVGNK